MSEYVPTSPEVNGIRDGWACTHVRDDITLEQAREAFDRWLASEKAEAWAEGRGALQIDPNPYEDSE